MPYDDSFYARWRGPAISVIRVVVALAFMEHGTQKVLGFPPGGGGAPAAGLDLVAAYLELIGGALVAVGLLTRFTSFVLAGEMAVAYFMAHAPHGFYPIANKGELAVLYCFFFLFLFVEGAGSWSLDALLFKRAELDPPLERESESDRSSTHAYLK